MAGSARKRQLRYFVDWDREGGVRFEATGHKDEVWLHLHLSSWLVACFCEDNQVNGTCVSIG